MELENYCFYFIKIHIQNIIFVLPIQDYLVEVGHLVISYYSEKLSQFGSVIICDFYYKYRVSL